MAVRASHWTTAHLVLAVMVHWTYSQGPPCVLPFYEYEGNCVETCPEFYYGNSSSEFTTCYGHCEPFPSDYQVQINATKFAATILRETPVDTPIIHITVTINVTHFPNLHSVNMDIVRNTLTEQTFNFGTGGTAVTIQYGESNPIDPAINATLAIERSIVYAQSVAVGTYDFDISVTVSAMPVGELPYSVPAQSLAVVIVEELCNPDPCQNDGVCRSDGPTLTFSCVCKSGYTGALCEIDVEVCHQITCENGGNCSEGPGAEFTCDCLAGFTGGVCEEDVDFCTPSTCLNSGTCIEGNGTLTTCSCPSGFNGSVCETDLDFCTLNSCQNGGTCSEGIGTEITCECPNGYSGPECEIDVDFCTSDPCQNGATCMDREGTLFNCTCLEGFTGTVCETDLDIYCLPDSCNGNGDCSEGDGASFSCSCFAGYSGENCENDLDFCTPATCSNRGTCFEGNGTVTSCVCVEGYSGASCANDDDFCHFNSCSNGGTCIEGQGNLTSCDCPPGYSGPSCEMDEDFCSEDTCLNGGICVDGEGMEVTCTCDSGFTGAFCEVDLDYCQNDTCLNGGMCIEGLGIETSCVCAEGFSGLNCNNDLEFCSAETCQNGGICIEGLGEQVHCNCTIGFAGTTCGDDDLTFVACQLDSCMNGGTCSEEFGPQYSCNCTTGFEGERCELDMNFCMADTCLNSGTCIEGYGAQTTCNCPSGFSGLRCGNDLDYCTNTSCLNNATCVEEYGPDITCECLPGFSGSQCENDLDFCLPTSCSNGGSCIDEVGLQTRCVCLPDFTGFDCSQLIEPCMEGLYYSSGDCVPECPEGYFADYSTRICTLLDSDYRVALSATVYTGSIASNTSLGTPVINFTMYIDNSYFQNPKTVTIHLVHISPTNTSAFTLENGENTITFTSNSNPSVPNAVSRSIFYSAVTTAGEYELSLVVSVTTGVDSGLDQALEVRGSLVQISIHGLPPEATTEEDSPEEDDFELEISVPVDNLFFWIAVGVAALLLFILLICVLVGLCKNRRGKKTSKYVIQENPYATVNDSKECQKAPEVMLKTNYSPTPLEVNEPDNDGYFAGVVSQHHSQEQATSFSSPALPGSQTLVHTPIQSNRPLPMTLLLQTPKTKRRAMNHHLVHTEGSMV